MLEDCNEGKSFIFPCLLICWHFYTTCVCRYFVDIIPKSWFRSSSTTSLFKLTTYSCFWLQLFLFLCCVSLLFGLVGGNDSCVWCWCSFRLLFSFKGAFNYLLGDAADKISLLLSITIVFSSLPIVFDVLFSKLCKNDVWVSNRVLLISSFERSLLYFLFYYLYFLVVDQMPYCASDDLIFHLRNPFCCSNQKFRMLRNSSKQSFEPQLWVYCGGGQICIGSSGVFWVAFDMLSNSFAFCSVRTSELSNVFVVGSVWTSLVKKTVSRSFGVFLLMTNFRSESFVNALSSIVHYRDFFGDCTICFKQIFKSCIWIRAFFLFTNILDQWQNFHFDWTE